MILNLPLLACMISFTIARVSGSMYYGYDLLLLHKNTENGMFGHALQDYALWNEDKQNPETDPAVNLYSIIGTYKQTHKALYLDPQQHYTFKLEYVNKDDTTVTLIWRQTSWLMDISVTGYDPINIPHEDVTLNEAEKFGGLSIGNSDAGEHYDGTLLDGTRLDETWNSVGRTTDSFNYTEPPNQSYMPGFNGQFAKSCRLYVYRAPILPTLSKECCGINYDNDTLAITACYYIDLEPKVGKETSKTVIIANTDDHRETNFDIYFTSNGADCFEPKITFGFELIDYGESEEYLKIYDGSLLTQTCDGNDGFLCGQWTTCVEDEDLRVSKISQGQTYKLTIVESAMVEAKCDESWHSYSIHADLTITCSAVPEPVVFEQKLILRAEDVRRGTFSTSLRSTGIENANNPHAVTHSIIGELNPAEFLDQDGYYQFTLINGNIDGTEDVLIWKQKSWLTTAGINGYVPISVPLEDNVIDPSAEQFGGLALVFSGQKEKCYFDGNGALNAAYWNCVGAMALYNGGFAGFNKQIAISQSLYILRLSSWVTDETTNIQHHQPFPVDNKNWSLYDNEWNIYAYFVAILMTVFVVDSVVWCYRKHFKNSNKYKVVSFTDPDQYL